MRLMVEPGAACARAADYATYNDFVTNGLGRPDLVELKPNPHSTLAMS